MNIQTAAFIALSTLFAGCDLESSDDDSHTPPSRPGTEQGRLGDRGISNLPYTTYPGGTTGITDRSGVFSYSLGDSVTFSVRGAALPTVPASSKITINTFDDITSTDSHDLGLNISTFLQSLDTDGDARNGIQLPTETVETSALASDISFNQAAGAFMSSPITLSAFTRGDPAPVTSAAAQANLDAEFNDLLLSRGGHWRAFALDGAATGERVKFDTRGFATFTTAQGSSYTRDFYATAKLLSLDGGDDTYRIAYEGYATDAGDLVDVIIYRTLDGSMLYMDNSYLALDDEGLAAVPPRAQKIVNHQFGYSP